MKRFALFTDKETFEEALGIHTKSDFIYKPNYNVSDGNSVPGIFKDEARTRLGHFIWGISSVADEHHLAQHMSNIENESTINRCLIPANGFFIWKDSVADPYPFYIRKISAPIFFMAAHYEVVEEENGHLRYEFSIILEDSNDLIKPVTPSMPLIIQKERLADWLAGDNIQNFKSSNNPMHLGRFYN